jgi:excisionase family DNA binding protein
MHLTTHDDSPEARIRPTLEPLQVTIREAATLLRYHERTIRRLIERGELRAVGQGRLRRIALADLKAWQDRNTT